MKTREQERLEEIRDDAGGWRRWGPYVSDRSWATVREDYSADGNAWDFLPHDLARSKAYRWGEDAIAGVCDRYQLGHSVTSWVFTETQDVTECPSGWGVGRE